MTDETPWRINERLVAAVGHGKKGNGTDSSWDGNEREERTKRWRDCLYENIIQMYFILRSMSKSSHYRGCTLSTEYISGVILHSETLLASNLAPLPLDRGAMPSAVLWMQRNEILRY